MNEPDISDIQTDIEKPSQKARRKRTEWIWLLLLLIVIIGGASLRLVGMKWDEDQYLHPDERFLMFVVSSIHPNENPGDFFNSAISTMNPENVGYTFYVYGTLPLFITHFVASAVGQGGWDIYVVGRYLSASFDILTILVTFLIGRALFKKNSIGVLAAAFYAFAVLPIQLSHYFTVDIQANFFSMAAIYCAVLVMNQTERKPVASADSEAYVRVGSNENFAKDSINFWVRQNWIQVLPYAAFGMFFGMAMACKISVVPIAGVVTAAAVIRWFRIPKEERNIEGGMMFRHLVVAGLLSIIVFRICQPYAFNGPGFFGFIPNQNWISDLRSLSGQSKGDVDFPPALQWSRRPLSFGFKNLTVWGLGLPLGIVAWLGFGWMLWQMARGRWKDLLLIWGWTAVYFTWQLTNFTSSMRYFMQIYSPLCVIAAWFLVDLWLFKGKKERKGISWNKALSVLLAVIVISLTAAYGFAFSRIYTRSVTRVEASRWYYQNIEGPVNVKISTDQGEMQQILPYEAGRVISAANPQIYQFTPAVDGIITTIGFDHIRGDGFTAEGNHGIKVLISHDFNGEEILGFGELFSEFGTMNDNRGDAYQLVLLQQVDVKAGEAVYLKISSESADVQLRVTGSVGVEIREENAALLRWQYLPEAVEQITQQQQKTYTLVPKWSGLIDRITIPYIGDVAATPGEKTLELAVKDYTFNTLGSVSFTGDFTPDEDGRGNPYVFEFAEAIAVEEGQVYSLEFRVVGDGGVAFFGTKQVNESSWDDNVPERMEGYDPYGTNDGVFRTDLNFEMYWDDNESKRDRFLRNLDEADIIMITSNRQWGTTTRVPERYPMTTMYYRELIGCPGDQDILVCYADAKPGMYEENLGFELIEVFQSNPNLGSFEINDQLAEEAFTVYDHPKVLIFKKMDQYDSEKVRDIFMQVDLSQVIHQVPGEVPMKPATPTNLLLPEDQLNTQQEGGTWSELFPPGSLVNQYRIIALIVWYFSITILGWVLYPFTRMAFSGLKDRGYAVSRLVGLLLLAWLSWMLGSVQVPVTRWTVWGVFIFILIVCGILFFRKGSEIVKELKENKKIIITIELIAIVFFTAFLLVRLGNPDLWHPYKGGEKPMDFSYWNAVLKSTTFPPYDPWFSGGYINYYYYGFVIVGMPVKALGITPSVAYNLVLPTMFSLFALAAFSIVYHVLEKVPSKVDNLSENRKNLIPFIGGIFGALLSLVIGNLGTIKMIFDGFIRLGGVSDFANTGSFTKIAAFIKGIPELFRGNIMPYYPGDWYWIPSRTIPNEPITEFPYFTFLYADPHAHLLALPITLLALLWGVSIISGKWQKDGKFSWVYFTSSLFLGGLAIGSLRPTNTWDLPVYLVLALIVVIYAMVRNLEIDFKNPLPGLPPQVKRWGFILLSVIVLLGLVIVMYQSFADWYGQGYDSIKYWGQDTTPVSSYLTHWGIFLFIILLWLGYESYDWMKETPISSLKSLIKNLTIYKILTGAVFAILIVLLALKVKISWIAFPMALWAGILILRPHQPDLKRLVFFMVGTGLVLTLAVELIVLEGDIGRMNTVFKFYLQAWVLLSLSAAAGLFWMYPVMLERTPKPWMNAIQIVLTVLLFCGILYPIMASKDKITDRIAKNAPHSLDGMAYMPFAEFNDQGTVYSLAEDYHAIQWMQQNVDGSPVIMEGNTVEYRWGNRFTIYTGLPSVVGWNWHQRQQRTIVSSTLVTDRVDDITTFYSTSDRNTAKEILEQYNVSYIIVGRMEQVYYPQDGLAKFSALNGDLWQVVYSEGETTIYKVLQ